MWTRLKPCPLIFLGFRSIIKHEIVKKKGIWSLIFCGNDITSVKRIEDAIKKSGEAFIKKVYTDEEIEYCESRRMREI